MFNTIFILEWDNYYNRRVHPHLINYQDQGLGVYLENDLVRFLNVNFNPNDGVNAEIILNMNESQKGNYLIVVDDANNIESRWFIIDENRIRGGQYKLTLHRDVITDYWNIIRQSPALIEKCNIGYDDPLIFNNEDMTFNQIKKGETLLTDKTNCPWLVAYIAKDATQGLTGNVSIQINDSTVGTIPTIDKTIDAWLSENETFYGDYVSLYYDINVNTGEISGATVNGLNGESFESPSSLSGMGYSSLRFNAVAGSSIPGLYRASGSGFKRYGLDALKDLSANYTPERHTKEETEAFLFYNNRLIQDSNGKVYKIFIKEKGTKTFSTKVSSGNLYSALSEAVTMSTVLNINGEEQAVFRNSPNANTFRIRATYNYYTVTAEEQPNLEVSYSINDSANRTHTIDAAYDIIAIPYGTIDTYKTGQGEDILTTNKEIGLATIQAIAKNMDAGCYDIQLLPYCPLINLFDDSPLLIYSDDKQVSFIKQGDKKVGIIYNVPQANFSINLFWTVDPADTAIDRKINNECDKWRLCSPNYSNYFDFSVEKNNGIQYFNVDCCYKPYSPYIHVNPNFNNLYGEDFNDPRGLVCGGDFSLTQVRDAWESYQLQNKNFQAAFDRQIQNMEFNNKYQKISEAFAATAGTLQGGVSGAATGLFATGGNPVGAAIGGAAGTLIGGMSGIADLYINEKMRNEALDYTKDQFGYQLGNIQAIPLTISKVSAFNENNKIFPVLEYYTCTDREKEALVQKLAYNGMTNMTIGTIDSVTTNTRWEKTINNKTIKSQNYIKAKPIYLAISEDFHITNEIAKEMNMGFYLVEEDE